jgi:hypothetical protein
MINTLNGHLLGAVFYPYRHEQRYTKTFTRTSHPLALPCPPQNRLNHLISQLGRLRKPRFKVLLNLLKLLAVPIEIAQINARAPVTGGKGELEVVGAERVVVDGRVNSFFEERWVAEEVFSDAEPHTGGLRGVLVRMWIVERRIKGVRTGVEHIM